MLKLFKNSFKTTNDCIIVVTPLIIFLSILGWYFQYAILSVDSIPKFILSVFTMFIMFCGCLSAWLYMVKKTIALSRRIFVLDKDRAKELINLFLTLPRGVGKLFLPVSGIALTYVILYGILFLIFGFFITKYAGTFQSDFFDVTTFFVSSSELIDEINSLSREELILINLWSFAVILTVTVTSFLTIYWIPEVVYGEKNPFKALLNAVKRVFKSFKRTLVLFVYIMFLAAAISVLNTFLMFNPFLYFIVLIFYYYFLVYIVVLLFTYYEQEFAY